MSSAYYNEHEPYAAQWLRNLVAAGHLPSGAVDARDIQEVRPDDCAPVSHFFAGIGGWPYALRLAGWPANRPVWTGSCPCQPFSVAGRGLGTDDPRHLWPVWFRLVRECLPPTIFGEQVADGSAVADWIDSVFADLEGVGYACGAAVLCAAGVGAPHQRHRLYWVAHRDPRRRGLDGQVRQRGPEAGRGREAGRVGHAHEHGPGRDSGSGTEAQGGPRVRSVGDLAGASSGMGDDGRGALRDQGSAAGPASPWSDIEWLWCRDGKYRPAQPGTFPLAARIPNRVGQLRAYGNAIVPQVAAAFVRAVMGVTR